MLARIANLRSTTARLYRSRGNYRAGLRVIETERIRGNCTQRSDAHSSCQVRFKNGFQERQSRFTGEVRRLDLYVQALDPQLQGLPLLRQEI